MTSASKGRHRKVTPKRTVAGRVGGIIVGLGIWLTMPFGQGAAGADPDSRSAWSPSRSQGGSGSATSSFSPSTPVGSLLRADAEIALGAEISAAAAPTSTAAAFGPGALAAQHTPKSSRPGDWPDDGAAVPFAGSQDEWVYDPARPEWSRLDWDVLKRADEPATGSRTKMVRSVAEDAAGFFEANGYVLDGAGHWVRDTTAPLRGSAGSGPINEPLFDAILFGGMTTW